MTESHDSPLKLLYCYAHEDKGLRDALDNHLANLKRQKLIKTWYDGDISAGREREQEMNNHLKTAHIVLLLISSAFLTSDYCYGTAMAQALKRHKEGTMRVIPIILRPVDWDDTPFSPLQVLPDDAKPVTMWQNIDEAYKNIATNLRKVIRELQEAQKNAEEPLSSRESTNFAELQQNRLLLSFANHQKNLIIANEPGRPLSDWYHITVHNPNSLFHVKNCTSYIESIIDMNSGQYIVLPSDHKTELIWAGTGDVTVNIPPGGKRDLDAFYTKNKYHQIFFQQRTTSTVYKYRNLLFGHYKMVYTFLSDNFLTASIEIEIDHEEKGLKIISHKP